MCYCVWWVLHKYHITMIEKFQEIFTIFNNCTKTHMSIVMKDRLIVTVWHYSIRFRSDFATWSIRSYKLAAIYRQNHRWRDGWSKQPYGGKSRAKDGVGLHSNKQDKRADGEDTCWVVSEPELLIKQEGSTTICFTRSISFMGRQFWHNRHIKVLIFLEFFKDHNCFHMGLVKVGVKDEVRYRLGLDIWT